MCCEQLEGAGRDVVGAADLPETKRLSVCQ